MGVLPLQFAEGESKESLGLHGHELFSIDGLDNNLRPHQKVTVRALSRDGEKKFTAVVRIDTAIEVDYYRNGGVLPYVLRQILKRK
jgi:aconitate hydratase